MGLKDKIKLLFSSGKENGSGTEETVDFGRSIRIGGVGGYIIPKDFKDAFDSQRHMASSGVIFSTMLTAHAAEDFVFQGNDYITKDRYTKRLNKFRKKHPEHFDECLETMHKKAYKK